MGKMSELDLIIRELGNQLSECQKGSKEEVIFYENKFGYTYFWGIDRNIYYPDDSVVESWYLLGITIEFDKSNFLYTEELYDEKNPEYNNTVLITEQDFKTFIKKVVEQVSKYDWVDAGIVNELKKFGESYGEE